jgi:toluene monooxygenase system protein E
MREAPKTYWHLAGARRMPTDYEVATSRLLYYVGRGFEVAVPLSDWYRRHQTESALACDDWDRFADPRETTYAKYVALQQAKEAHVDGLLRSIEDGDYDRKLDPRWVDTLERLLPPLRYLYHGLQMVAAYVGQMAPSGRITIVAALQAADEMRRVHRLAYRMAMLRRLRPDFGESAKQLWERDPAWQPLRQLIETLLVTYDWGEAFVALNLGVKPVLDRFVFLGRVAETARARGDYLLGEIFFSLGEDGTWHNVWAQALATLVTSADVANHALLAGWTRAWSAAATQAIAPLASELGVAA